MMFVNKSLIAVLLALGLGAAAPVLATEERPLFRLGGLEYAESDLSPELRQRVADAYAAYRDAIDEIVLEAAFALHVEAKAQRAGKDEASVRAELLPSEPIDAAEIEAFYEARKARIRVPLAQVRGRIEDFLQGQRRTAAMSELVAGLRRKGELEDALPPAVAPQLSIDTAGYPAKGAGADAPVTVVEFADYQCPHCKRAAPVVEKLLGAYGDKVRVVFMDFPINPSGISRLVARGAVCAAEQDRFWPYHDMAFARQGTLSKDSPADIARANGLDMTAFEACYAAQRSATQVGKAEAQATALGVNSTPTFYVNGRRVRVTRGLASDLEAAVKAAMAASG